MDAPHGELGGTHEVTVKKYVIKNVLHLLGCFARLLQILGHGLRSALYVAEVYGSGLLLPKR